MSPYATAILVCLVLAASMVHLLRTRRIREKYAAIWIVLTSAVILIGAFPQLAFWLAHLVGVQTPANLLFALALVVLLAVCVQLSTEVSGLEEETRTLAEEVALLRLEVGGQGGSPGGTALADDPAAPDLPDPGQGAER